VSISNGQLPDANDILNVYSHGGNVLVGKTGTVYLPVYINNADGVRNVKLALWGKAAGASATALTHGVGEHTHTGSTSGSDPTDNTGTNVVADTAVPEYVQIWIDGTEYTNPIGDPNNKDTVSTISVADASTYSGSPGSYTVAKSFTGLDGVCRYLFLNLGHNSSSGTTYCRVKFYFDDETSFTTAAQSHTGNNPLYTAKTFENSYATKTVTQIDVEINGANSLCKDVYVYSGWGVDGTTAWDTGWLTLTSVISWTAGWHYIELKETGGIGGTLIYQIGINVGTD